MSEKIKILMIDDHPSMIEGYKIILSYNDLGYEIETTSAFNCKDAYDIITNPSKKDYFDIVFLDYSLPSYEEKNIVNGEDLALLVKKYSPSTKIVILTSHIETLILYNIIKKVDPNGLLVKSDFTAEELLKAFEAIINNEIYNSATVKASLKELLSKDNYLDDFNRQMLTLLSQGIKTKNLPQHMNLSMSSIEKRKVQIKLYLGIEKGTDEDVIREAKKRGLI
ncbi:MULTISPECIES: response regulator [Flavobacterium]|uniref:Response regulator transcription factor n=1 Tax=Flavobacterium hankyongi TaxID=1176532 RepID=A0ABP8ZN69_9FLAO|nr:response regulator [Flavobacterium sp. N1846]